MEWLTAPVIIGLIYLTKYIIEEISKKNAEKKWQERINNTQKTPNSRNDDWTNWSTEDWKKWSDAHQRDYFNNTNYNSNNTDNNSIEIEFEQKIMLCHIAFFECLGKIAKADGRVSRAEADYIGNLMTKYGFDDNKRKILKKAFNSGRDSQENFYDLIDKFHHCLWNIYFNDTKKNQKKELYTEYFCELANIDSITNPQVIEMLKIAGHKLGTMTIVKKYLISSSEDIIHINQTYSLNDKYAILGVPPSASEVEIKRAYRKKSLEFHPDRLQGKGFSEEYQNFAKQEYLDIQEAYNEICKARGIK